MKKLFSYSALLLAIILFVIPIGNFVQSDIVYAATSQEKKALKITKEIKEEYHTIGGGLSKKRLKVELSDLSYFGYDENFSKKEIDYAVKNCGINWKKEALFAVNQVISVYDEYYDEPVTTDAMYNTIAQLCFTKQEMKWAFKKAGFPDDEIKEVLGN